MNLGIKNLIEYQKGVLEKFVTSNKQNIIEKLGDSLINNFASKRAKKMKF